MLIFGHTGITLGVATVVAGTASRQPVSNWFTTLSRYIDIRVLLVGSLLPDIIDKPVGQFFFRETFSNGRIFSHTLLFFIVLAAVGFWLFKRYRQVWMLTLAAGTFMHLVLDSMWTAPATLFWPLMGLEFEKEELTGWLWNIFKALVTYPDIFIPEIIGLAVLVWFGLTLVFRKKVGVFLKYGKT
jgi:inner membrane protein